MQPWTQCSLHDQSMIGQLNVIDYSQLAFEGWLMTWDSYGVHQREIGRLVEHLYCLSINQMCSVNSCIVCLVDEVTSVESDVGDFNPNTNPIDPSQ